MVDGGPTENPVPPNEVRDIAEKRNEVRARTIIDGLSRAQYAGDSISLYARRVSPADMRVDASEIKPDRFKNAIERLSAEFEATQQNLDFLQEGTLSLNYTDKNKFAVAGMGKHPSYPQPHLEPYYFQIHFHKQEALNEFLDWIKENPNEAMTQVFERLMQRPEQEGKSYDEASYFAHMEPSQRDFPYTESHPFQNNKIKRLLVKRDTEDVIEQKNF